MKYLDAVLPSAIMAGIFIAVMITILRNQGGANSSKEDATLDAQQAAQASGQEQQSPRSG